MFVKKHFWWDVRAPEMKQFIGRHVKVKDDDRKEKVIEIERIMGNLADPHMFEIVSKEKHYKISMLDFFAQMNGEKVTEQEIKAFDETIYDVKANRSALDKVFGKRTRGGVWTK